MELTKQEQEVIENNRKTEENSKLFLDGISKLSDQYNRVLVVDRRSALENPQITIVKKDETKF